jgi:Protein of unknown function (DUF551).
MGEWQTIDTAPKDGTLILCVCMKASNGSEDRIGTMQVDRWVREYNGFGAFNNRYWPPTHWMPLPSPPKTGDTP